MNRRERETERREVKHEMGNWGAEAARGRLQNTAEKNPTVARLENCDREIILHNLAQLEIENHNQTKNTNHPDKQTHTLIQN